MEVNDIPDEILNLQPPIKGLKIIKNTPKKKSQFHFVMNTNISYKSILGDSNKQHRIKLMEELKTTLDIFKSQIKTFLKHNTDDSSKCNLTNFKAYVELGKKKKFIHIDGYMFFDNYCLLNIQKVNTFFNSRLSGYSKGVYFNIKYISDNIANIIDYAGKDGHKLI